MAQKRLSTQILQDIPICADRAWHGRATVTALRGRALPNVGGRAMH